MERVRFLNETDWVKFTNGTLKPSVGAERIENGDLGIPVRVDVIREIAVELLDGNDFLPPVLLGLPDGSKMVVVEGNTRIAAYALSHVEREIEVIYGSTKTEELALWAFYPKMFHWS